MNQNKTESIQHEAFIAITGAIQETSRERFYQEFGLESLRDRCRFRKPAFFTRLCKVFFCNISLST